MPDMPPLDDFKKAIREEAFVTLSSGARIIASEEGVSAPWIFDFRAMLLQGKWLDRYAEIFWEKYASKYPFQVCAMESAGISLVAAIVMKGLQRGTPINGFFIRKSRKRQGLMKQIEGVVTDEAVILVDDLINSGNTFKKMLQILDEISARVTDIFTIIAFRDLDAYGSMTSRGISVSSLFTLTDFGLPLLTVPATLAEPFEILWRFQGKDPSFHFVIQKSAPLTDSERVYLGSDAGTFYALNASDGSVAWTFETGKHPEGKGIFSSPALYGDTVFFGAYDGNVYALDRATGKKRWVYDDADWIGSSPALAPDQDSLFIGLEFGLLRKRGGIACLSMKTGALKWQQRTSEYTHGSPLYIKEEELVVIGSNDGVAYGYDAISGELRWNYKTRGGIKSSFAYDQKRKLVIFGSMDGVVYALSAKNGVPVFVRETGAGIYSTPLVVNDTAYIASLDKCLYAIDLDSGKDKWVFETNGRIFSSPVFADGSLWIGSNDGRVYEIDLSNGKSKGFFQATERIVNKVAYEEKSGRMFVPTVANEIYCLVRTGASRA